MSITKSHMEKHSSKECALIMVWCDYGCGNRVTRRDLPVHMKEICDKRNICCEDCGEQFWAEEKQVHLNEMCPERIVLCEYGCSDSTLRSKHLIAHMADHCPNRMITCLCGEQVMHKMWPEHDVAVRLNQ